jgi:hypothetical protein
MAKVKTYWEEKIVESGFMPFHTTTSYKNLGSKMLDSNNLPKIGDKVVGEYGVWVVLDKYFYITDGAWKFIVSNIKRYNKNSE